MDPLIKTLGELRAIKKVADEPGQVQGARLDAPVAIVSVTAGAEGEEPRTLGPLTIGAATAEDSQHRYATSENRPGVYLISQALVEEIRDTVKAIRRQ